MSGTIEDRFNSKVAKGDVGECWEWQGCRNNLGYGWFFLEGKRVRAHRVSYAFNHGPIPLGMVVRHRCDNPPCVNPSHLEVGTQGDNVRDIVKRGRMNKYQLAITHCPSGHEYSEANTRIYAGKRHCRACDRARKTAQRLVAA